MKLLALVQPGTVSRGLMHDIITGYERAGHEVLRLELEPLWAARQAMAGAGAEAATTLGRLVAQVIEKNGIDLTCAMWGNGTHLAPLLGSEGGRVRSFFDRHAMPMLHYWWDAPHWWLDGAEHENIRNGLYSGEHQLHCINNAATGAEMANLMGFRNVLPLPNAAEPSTFAPCADVEPDYDLVFVSGPGDPPPTAVMLEELERDDPDVERIRRDVADRLGPALDELAASAGGGPPLRALLEAMVEARLGDRHAPALAHVQTAAHVSSAHAVAAESLLGNLGLYLRACALIRSIETWERPFLVAYLSRHFKCLRLGDQGYDAWGVAGDATGLVPYEQQHRAYARGRAALNVMRWQDDVGLNSKIFEITACRTLCLQAYRAGLDPLFEAGREVLVFRTPGEARALLADTLADPARATEIAGAGYRRTLREHTWAHRAAEVARVGAGYWNGRGRTVAPPDRSLRLGAGARPGPRLAFTLAPLRSGSTLLRKMLDAHPLLASPPESWFLLPLLSVWHGDSTNERFDPRQAAVGLRSIADRAAFADAARAFAARVLGPSAHPACQWLVEKTPLYLQVHRELAELFPESRFIVLLRDPRAIAWSFFTWEKVAGQTLDAASAAAAVQVQQQHAFVREHPHGSLLVRYEALCTDPEATCRAVCRFLDVPYETEMIRYGRHSRAPAGYGDEGTLAHEQPHTGSLDKWRGTDVAPGMSVDEQRTLAERCGPDALADLGFDDLAQRLVAPSQARQAQARQAQARQAQTRQAQTRQAQTRQAQTRQGSG